MPAGVAVDMRAVKARKDGIVRQSNEGVAPGCRDTPGVTVIEAHARFEGPHTVRAGDALLEAPQIFVNIGGRASVPPICRHRRGPAISTTSSMMDVDTLPEHL